MLDYGAMKNVAIFLLGVTATNCTAQENTPLPLAVTLAAVPRVLVADRPADIEIVLHNAGDAPLSFGTWSCGWDTQWQIRQDGNAIGIAAPACTRNVRRTIRLAAGGTYVRSLTFVARPVVGATALRVALGFQPLDASRRYWSAPFSLSVSPGSAPSSDDDPPPSQPGREDYQP